jgi:hypothetical protein
MSLGLLPIINLFCFGTIQMLVPDGVKTHVIQVYFEELLKCETSQVIYPPQYVQKQLI